MRERLTILLILALTFASIGVAQAADVGGEFVGELRVLTKEDKPLDDAVASLAANTDIEGELGDLGNWKLGLEIRLDKALNMFKDDIWDADDTDVAEDNITLELDEAYLDFYSVGDEPLDLRLGKQYVDLGVGDGITTFNLTRPVAANFIDELQNTRAVTGLRADYYHDDVNITAFVQPRVTPTKTGRRIDAVYQKVEQGVLTPDLAGMLFPDVKFGGMPNIDDESPNYDDDGIGFTLRATRFVGGFDLGAVYQRGYVSSRIVRDFRLEPMAPPPGTTEDMQLSRLVLTKGYLPMQKLGVTAEGTWGDAGVWGELTYNMPKEDFFSPYFDNPALPEEYRLNSDKYMTGLVGMDYFLENGTYINGQIIHGFPQEVTKNMLNTYLTGDIYQDFLNSRLRLEATVVYCFDDQGWIIMPEAVYQLDANKKCFGKLAFPGGDEESLFRQMEDLTQILAGISISF